MNKLWIIFLLISSIAFSSELIEKTVAIVNGEVVFESDFSVLKQSLSKPGKIDDLIIPTTLDDLKSNRKNQLDYLINEKILTSEIKRLNFSITQERIDQEIKTIAKQNNLSPEEFVSAIKSQGVSFSQYRQFLKDKIERQTLVEAEIISKLRVSDDMAFAEFMKTHSQREVTINEFSISHIFFSPKKGGAQAALSRAETVYKKLMNNESFEKLAEQYSEDPNFASGGFLGSFHAGEFIPEIEKSILSVSVGQLTPIVKSRQGFHIVKLISKKIAQDPLFEKEKEKIKSKIFEGLFKEQFKKWLAEKKDSAYIKINN